jgi:hypothetical protein
MLRLPNCDFCKYCIDDDEKDRCSAHPDGIPPEIMIKADKGVKCANGYSFEEIERPYYGEPKPDGLLSRMLCFIGGEKQ